MAGPLQALLDESRTVRRPRGGGAPLPERLAAVVIVGATCTGKTTLSGAVRESEAARAGRICVPERFITRTRRLNDCAAENRHVSHAEFARLVRTGAIRLHWRRRLEPAREERYGFPAVPAGVIPVYSGNNALLEPDARVEPADALAGALVIVCHAPPAVRAERLRHRSPDLVAGRPAEAAQRLADASAGALERAHVVVHNHGAGAARARAETARLVTLAVQALAPSAAR